MSSERQTKTWWWLALLSLGAVACSTEVDELDPTSAGGNGAGGQGAGAGGTGAGAGGTGGSTPFNPVIPEAGVATDITLAVYSDGWGELLDTLTLTTEGPVAIDVVEQEPYSDPPAYYIYATAEGFYTELYKCTKGQSIDVDLDAVPDSPNAFAGVIFARQSYFADSYVANTTIQVTGGGITTTLTTDSQGRYGLEGLPAGDYTLDFTHQDEGVVLETSNATEGVDYLDLSFYEAMQAS